MVIALAVNTGKRIASAALLGIGLLVLVSGPVRGQSNRAPDANNQLQFKAVALHQQVIVGAPVFIKLGLHNTSGKSQKLWLGSARNLGEMDWHVDIADANGSFIPVKARVLGGWRQSIVPEVPTVVPADGQIAGWIALWFRADSDIPGERRLLFPSAGSRKYQIRMEIAVGEPRESIPLAATGRVKVTGRPRGYADMVRGLREIMLNDQYVAYRNRAHLDRLIDALGDSPYAPYVKWLRLRSYLLDGQDESGHDAMEGAGADTQAKRLLELATDIIDFEADRSVKESPMLRDALAARGMMFVVKGRKKEARDIYKVLEATYGYSRELKRFKQWAF